eukprot:CAMPEP_0198684904 /NCGR_PEP_ID=MMETSP1468-20131203/12902_1 /TAXON_ID=1461545 /ORGANISM="Mantoniella sp, Strain CCMP1436" /LENGTH=90 /DNA_ID=CAMNT_0044430061 /DNA_START=235 /DNA_END=505 /DNA_ORIENTATION=+
MLRSFSVRCQPETLASLSVARRRARTAAAALLPQAAACRSPPTAADPMLRTLRARDGGAGDGGAPLPSASMTPTLALTSSAVAPFATTTP